MLLLLPSVLISSLMISCTEAAKILAVYPAPCITHHTVFRTLTLELLKQGHELTVVTPYPMYPKEKTPPNLLEIDVHDISHKIWSETFMKVSKGNKDDLPKQIKIAFEALTLVFDAQIQTKEVQAIVNKDSNTYDLLILEACVRPALVFGHIFNAPVVAVNSFGALPWYYETMGIPEHPTLYTSIYRHWKEEYTMWEKITDIYDVYKISKIFQRQALIDNRVLIKRFGPDTPTVGELSNNVDLLFLNSDPVFEGIRPEPPNVIHVGGLHLTTAESNGNPLPTHLEKFCNSSKNGVIYVSFGTNLDTTLLPAEKVQILMRVFSKLTYDILLKWGDDKLTGNAKNIKISKWVPQSDLLKHPKLKLFITHGGVLSTDEAIAAGVPLIGIPMSVDQWTTVANYVRHGIGMQINLDTLTEGELTYAINKVIGGESYRRNIVRLRALMMDQPMTSLQRAMWWIDYVLRHGGAKHLRSPAANITWYQYLELDLVLPIFGVFLLVLITCIVTIYLLYRYIKSKYIKLKKS